MFIAGKYKATPTAFPDGSGVQIAVDAYGNLRVSQGAALDDTGAAIFPDNYAQTLAYNGDGLLETVSFTDGVNTWTQTLTYTGGLLTGVSTWVRS